MAKRGRSQSQNQNDQYFLASLDIGISHPEFYEYQVGEIQEFGQDITLDVVDFSYDLVSASLYWTDSNTGNWGTSADPDLSTWSDTSGTGCTVSIIESLDGHSDIMKFDDQSSSEQINNVLALSDGTDSGIVEFSIRSEDVTDEFIIVLGDCISFSIDDDKFQYYDGIINHDLMTIADNNWYDIKIIYALSTFSPDLKPTAKGVRANNVVWVQS